MIVHLLSDSFDDCKKKITINCPTRWGSKAAAETNYWIRKICLYFSADRFIKFYLLYYKSDIPVVNVFAVPVTIMHTNSVVDPDPSKSVICRIRAFVFTENCHQKLSHNIVAWHFLKF